MQIIEYPSCPFRNSPCIEDKCHLWDEVACSVARISQALNNICELMKPAEPKPDPYWDNPTDKQ